MCYIANPTTPDQKPNVMCVAVQWYVLSAVAGVCLLLVVAATTVCAYRYYRRRRGSGPSVPPLLASPSGSPGADGLGVVAGGGGLKHGSVQHSRGQPQPQRKSSDQQQPGGDGFHGPTCTVTGDHGVVCQVGRGPNCIIQDFEFGVSFNFFFGGGESIPIR